MRNKRSSAALSLAVALVLAAALPASPAQRAHVPVITVSVVSAPLPALLQAVARAAGVSITVDSTVPQDARATIHLNQVPMRTAWDVIEHAYGLLVREAAPGVYVASRPAAAARGFATPPGWDGTVLRVWRLTHAAAEEVARALSSLFGQGVQPQPAASPAPTGAPARPQAPPTQAEAAQTNPVAIAAIPATNQIVVRTTPHMAFLIGAAIRQMDSQATAQPPSETQQPQPPRSTGPTTELYTLRHARASAVASILTSHVRDIQVSYNDAQNALLVTASPAQHDRVRQVLETIDRPTAQLVVEAEVFSVQDNVQQTLGIDWTLDAVYTLARQPDGSLVGTLDPFQVVSRLRAAASQGRARVLSRPRVLTVSGQQATITVGDQVPVLSRDAQGNTVVVTTVNAGMRLQVTPRILPDGNVELTLAAEANSLSGFVQDTPIISQRSVQTRLVVQDSTPVIIGGLIGENKSTTSVKLPLLGDLPILGALFRTTTDRAERVEVIMVVTPRVVSPGPITAPSR
ncbi:MAG: secretin N-terminal domain-containing protein [Armatimonadota bacterium]|nr:secretin N-terminal domain-containing protein [Armatimonadota bacterium]MDR7613142.1 secretin N-terminal domain-containing protein [Armatimonadota bacterium]